MKPITVKIFDWQIVFCKGDYCAATLLSFFIQKNNLGTNNFEQSNETLSLAFVYNVFKNKFEKELIDDSFALLKKMAAVELKENQILVCPKVYQRWLENFSNNKENNNSLELTLDHSYEFENSKNTHYIISQSLQKLKEIKSIESSDKLEQMEILFFETIISLRARIVD